MAAANQAAAATVSAATGSASGSAAAAAPAAKPKMIRVTCKAPVNIAVIKYWGKRDEKLILPYNDSISGTLSMDQMSSKTTIAASASFERNRFWLNGCESEIKNSDRLNNCLNAVRALAESKNTDRALLALKLHIASENNFPTAAGLASSAAGYACLVYTLACLYGVEKEDLTPIARLGSGSACRSLYGGFVHWLRGNDPGGRDSCAVPICERIHWPDMHVLVLVVNAGQKKVSSTDGMATTVQNSELFRHRIERCVGRRVERMKKAIAEKDFATFAEITMKDSNQFHAVCLDSFPPIVYLNDVSHSIMQLVHKYNEHEGETRVAYTFDAGPNAVLYLRERHVPSFVSVLTVAYPATADRLPTFIRGMPVEFLSNALKVSNAEQAAHPLSPTANQIRYIIHTKIGDGPKRLPEAEGTFYSVLGESGWPLRVDGALTQEGVEMEQRKKRLKRERRENQLYQATGGGDDSDDDDDDPPPVSHK